MSSCTGLPVVVAVCLASSWAIAAPPPPRVAPSSTPPTRRELEGDVGGLRLQPIPGGGYRYIDPQAGFSARIHPDGHVTFVDHSVGPRQPALGVAGFDPFRRRELPQRAPFPQETVNHGEYGPPPILFTLGFAFGGLMDLRANRSIAAKQRFSSDTAPLRERLAARWRSERSRTALLELGTALVALWRDTTVPLSVKKSRLFERWDECSEPGPSDDLDEHPGARARARIETFVRQHLPASSPDAFTSAELANLNGRRRSRAKFDPYEPEATEGSPASSSSAR